MARAGLLLIAAVFALLAASPAAAQIDFAPKVHARLVAEHKVVAPGSTLSVALEEDIRAGWHTYWINPGEAGAPTEIKWTLPRGWRAGPIAWPYPKRLPVPPFMNYGYEGKLWLLSNLTVPADAKRGSDVALAAAVDWLVCKDICVPEDATVSVTLRIGGALSPSDPAIAAQFAAARAKLPVLSPWPLRYRLSDNLDLFAMAPALAAARPIGAEFFPFAGGEIVETAPQALGFARDGVVLRLAPSRKFRAGQALSGLLVFTSADGSVSALVANAGPGAVPAADFAAGSDMGIALALLFAFVGGLIPRTNGK